MVAVRLEEVVGAVYRPDAEIVPALADHVTAVLLFPVTVAVNCWLLPDCRVAEAGEIEMLSGSGGGGGNPMLLPPPLQPRIAMHRIKHRGKVIETTNDFFMFEHFSLVCK
jgi:hypothetical protein